MVLIFYHKCNVSYACAAARAVSVQLARGKAAGGEVKIEEYVNAGRSDYGSIEQYTALGTELTKFHIFMVLRI